jgi:thioredoxin-related protein
LFVQRLLALLLVGFLPLFASASHALSSTLPAATDLRAASDQAAQSGAPLVLMFSRKDCKYCETVRRQYLIPLAEKSSWRTRVVVRQIDQDSDAPLIDFDGALTTHASFAKKEKIRLVPVVAFYGPEGKPLAGAIVGALLPDFYPSYLEAALEKSSSNLRLNKAAPGLSR